MKATSFFFVLSVLIGVSLTATIWPKPANWTETTTTYQLDSNQFSFAIIGYSSDILTKGIQRYKEIIFYNYPWNHKIESNENNYQNFSSISINVLTNNQSLSLGTDESYELYVNSTSGIYLQANSVYGAIRGLETFAQIVTPVYVGSGITNYIVNGTTISDAPRFPHRGYLLDTARHYLPLNIIYQQIDALAYNKFNVLHWHIVDDQSFPYKSEVWPLLIEGAYYPTHIYTLEEIKNIVNYAKERGVRVLPEFDSPGHTDSWGVGYPQLLTPCYDNGEPTGQRTVMYPISNFTYEFIYRLFEELNDVFIDDYFHIGGDEVSYDCWASNPNITSFMNQKGWGTDYSKLEQYYENRVLAAAEILKKDYIVWQEVIDDGVTVKPSTVVEVWKNPWQEEVAKITKLGYKTLLSAPWYLNYISYGEDWPTYYSVEPTEFVGTNEQKDLVFGGEACMWGEFVDGTNSVARTWPRASAIGERLWSTENTTDINDATNRIHDLRCKLIKRNIPAEPPNGPSYCDIEFSPNYNPPGGY